ncbi:M67 family metallopeptidase [Desmonostoc muscorum CCALA 125]|uniref:M67 family metallopeptidase n=1 Tax=Desmonostoc muscorum LEGE 12446 TaxID=1828758 RepID=A0A8J7AFS7_DESMC|nr:M67 family metallopeptidase [Desmonostoc muscorum]MBX9256851.1 M67 family metallopeptidase [Desmonostoc muscorum CCALA 125]MCF2150053.1 M67 family metallopeptidase [Desmonostoc muscorum LEGE 12446]
MIKFSEQHLQIIRTHAENIYPEECCGIILGYLANEGKTTVEVMPTENVWNTEASAEFSGDVSRQAASLLCERLRQREASPTRLRTPESKKRQYTIAPQVMLQAQKQARDRSLNIIGIFHSHPDHPAIPSECDRLYAWQGYSYIIVSVQNGKATELRSWSLDDTHQFQAETIENII